MRLSLSRSIYGKPVKQRDKKRRIYESAAVNQVISDVNKRMREIATKDNGAE